MKHQVTPNSVNLRLTRECLTMVFLECILCLIAWSWAMRYSSHYNMLLQFPIHTPRC